jgi:hypothetical protein
MLDANTVAHFMLHCALAVQGETAPAFYSLGLAQWEAARAKWRAASTRPRIAPPPPLDDTPELYDKVVSGVINAHAGHVLPGRITLPDLVRVLNDIWEVCK